ncbi:MAG TPA: hypothetical protein VGR28_00330 [Candidatus Thermoplasmatota archaeon]|nr:hypothetical protein [Candidatus Thermoplasmatota archaeon]
MGVLDFLVEWTIGTIIVVAAVLAVVVLAGSYGLAFAWRKWKERRRAQRARGTAPAKPAAPTGVGFAQRVKITKLPRPSLPRRKG